MKNFNAFGLHEEVLRSLAKLNFITPTPIQEASIPAVLEGKDILGTSQTGSGKTGAFGIPLVSHLINNDKETALVIVPTRELATQVTEVFRKILQYSRLNLALLIGGEPIVKQLSQLHKRPRLIIGTPGRINDHIKRKSVKLNNTQFLVLDEIDRMLDMGFGIQINQILDHLPKERQTLMFSATLPNEIQKLAKTYLNDPVRIEINTTNQPVAKIKQETLRVSANEKYNQLLTQLDRRTGSVIVFVKTKSGADKLATKLRDLDHAADAFHGDLRQRQRDKAVRLFRDGKNRIMVATDIAARGLDIPHIEHVINYDLPDCPEDYIHRIGRTGRAGAEGEALSLVSPQDSRRWNDICRLFDTGEVPPQRPANTQQRSQRERSHFKGKSEDRPRFMKKMDDRPSFKDRGERSEDRASFGRRSERKSPFHDQGEGKSHFKKRTDSRSSDRSSFKSRSEEKAPFSGRAERKPFFKDQGEGKSSFKRKNDDRPSFKSKSEGKSSYKDRGDNREFSKDASKKRKPITSKPGASQPAKHGSKSFSKPFARKESGSYKVRKRPAA